MGFFSPVFIALLALLTVMELGASGEFESVYGGSSGSSFTRELKKTQGAPELLQNLGKWFEATSLDVKGRRQQSDGSECTLRGQPWIEEAKKYAEDRKISEIDESCATRTEHTGSNLTMAFRLLDQSANTFQEAGGKAVLSDTTLSNIWRVGSTVFSTYAIKNLIYKEEDQDCLLNYLAGVRVNDTWYVAAAVTNTVPNAGGERKRFVEHVASDLTAPLAMSLFAQGITNRTDDRRSSYTTAFAELTGSSHISRVHRMDFGDNRALNNALETNILAVDQAQDAITPANMAILILPLCMSFIPVALIADLSEVATFFYVLLTDVFAAVPFVIKGVELVITGTTTQRNAETWLVGNDDGPQVAETWAAACKPVTKFRTIGIVIIVFGITSILSGILIEYIARKWMNRKRDEGEHPEPFGPALLRMDAYIPIGANYMPANANYDDALSPNIAADLPPPPPAAAAGPSSPAPFSNLFSGLLGRHIRRRRNEAGPSAPVAGGGSVGITPAVLGVRQRGSAHSGGVEYEEMI